ncbi:MAG: RHS repeat-associated core domain-containing protein [Pirellulales bacterium]
MSVAPRSNRLRRRQAIRRFRRPQFERLDPRIVLASLHQNAFDEFDVNDDGFTAPLDALLVINELNNAGTHALTGPAPRSRFLDVSGDAFVAPLDALLVINVLNDPSSVDRVALTEQGNLAEQGMRTVTIPTGMNGRRVVEFELATRFDAAADGFAPGDQVLVYLVDPANPQRTLVDRGAVGTTVFALTSGRSEYATGLAAFDGRTVSIDATELPGGTQVGVKVQLVDANGARGTRVVARGFNAKLEAGSAMHLLPTPDSTLAEPGPAVDLSTWSVSTDVEWEFSNPRWDESAGRYQVEVRARGDGVGLSRDVALAFPGLPVGVQLLNATGAAPSAEPYVNFRSAVGEGGLDRGGKSAGIDLTFVDPQRRPLALHPTAWLGTPNRAPTLESIPPITIRPGGRSMLPLSGVDPDGDLVRYLLSSDRPLPNVLLTANGELVVAPAPSQLGDYQFQAVATDGRASTARDVVIHVIADPLGTTRVSGQVLLTTGAPVAGIPVEIGGVVGLTDVQGRFLLDLGNQAVVATTIKIRGDLYSGGPVLPFIAEHLSLTLDHEVYAGYENQIVRPIYLPVLDVENGTPINPTMNALVDTPALPGVSVFVAAGTLMNQQGSPFTGVLSITEVPVDLTPIALPEDLHPDLVVTIQPGDMVFASPAPMTFPNSSGWAPGTQMDLWSINPATGQFDDVGDMVVSADGLSITTVSGGVRNSSWHFTTAARKPPVDKTQKTCGCDCEPCKAKESTRGPEFQVPTVSYTDAPAPSDEVGFPGLIRPFYTAPTPSKTPAEVGSANGALSVTRFQVAYQAQGEIRGTSLTYDSLRADPRPIVRVGLAVNPDPESTSRIVGRLEMSRGGVSIVAPGAEGGQWGLAGGENFFRGNPNDFLPDMALQADLTTQPTGVYRYELTSGGRQFDGKVYSGSSDRTTGQVIVVNSRRSVFGAGWGLAGFEQLSIEPDGSVLIVDGGGGARYYERRTAVGGGEQFIALPGDSSTLVRQSDGVYLNRTPEGTVSRFSASGRLESITESNGRQTRYQYDGIGNLAKIIDSAGLETRFEYVNGKVTRIVDPADRITSLDYDALGNLILVTDPDGVASEYEYDSQHRMAARVDELGQRERYAYGFDGRIRKAFLANGTSKQFNPLESQGLYPVELTRNPATAPTAPSSPQASLTLAANGTAAAAALSQAGQLLSRTDDLGRTSYGRDDVGQVTSVVNGRGQVTLYTYDDHGGITSIEQELPGAGAIVGGFAGVGEVDEYTFHGEPGQLLYFDALDDVDSDGVTVKLVQPTGGALTASPFGGVADRDDGPYVLRQSGEYRLQLRGASGDYRFRLLDVTNQTPLTFGDRKAGTAAEDDEYSLLAFPVEGVAGRRLRIEETSGTAKPLTWELTSLDGRPVASATTGQVLEAVLPFSGRYMLTVAKSLAAPSGPVTFDFQVVDATPAAIVPRTGFGEFSGSIAPGEVDRYEFTSPGGRAIFVSSQVEDFSFSLNATLVLPSGRRISTAVDFLTDEPLAFPLFESGTYAIEVSGRRANSSGSYRLEWRDVADSAESLALNAPVTLSLDPGKTRVLSFPAVAGDRQFLQYLEHVDARISVVELNPYGNSREKADSDFTGTHYLLMKLDPESAPLDVSIRLDSLTSAVPLVIGQTFDGALEPDDPAAYFKFTAKAGDRLYVGDRLDVGTGIIRVLVPPGAAPLQLWTLDSAAGFLDVPVDGEYFLAILNESPPLFDSMPFTLSLTVPPTNEVGEFSPGEIIAGEVIVPGETREYTVPLPTGRYLAWSPPTFLSLNLTEAARTFVQPFNQIFELKTPTEMRLQAGGSDTVGQYEFELFSLDAAPLLAMGGNSEISLPADRATAMFRAPAAVGRRYLVRAQDLAGGDSASWRAYDATGALIGEQPLSMDWEITSVDAGELTFLLESPAGGDAATFVPVLTDITGASLTRTTTGGVVFGQLDPFEQSEFSFIFLAGDVIQVDRQDGFEGPPITWTGPDGSSMFGGESEQTAFVAPVSGSYLLAITNYGTDIADYRFRVQNLPVDAALIATGAEQTGALSSGLARDVYRFEGRLDEVIVLDGLRQNFNGPELSLLDAQGKRLDVMADVPLRLPYSGTYYIAIAGGAFSSETEPASYAFRVLDCSEPQQVPPLSLGTLVEGQFPDPAAMMLYRVTAAAGQRLAFLEEGQNVLSPAQMYDSLGRLVPWTEANGYLLWTAPFDGEYTIAFTTFFVPAPSYSFRVTAPEYHSQPIAAAGSVRKTFEYDPVFHRVTREVDELGRATITTLDPANGNVLNVRRVVGEPGGDDDAVVSFTYTPAGSIETITDELGRVTRLTYDARENLIEIRQAVGTPDEIVERMEYDVVGRLTAYVDAEGARSEFQYDAGNRLTRVLRADPDGNGPFPRPVKMFEYDATGKLTRVVDELGHATRWEYDSLGRTLRKIDALNQVTALAYNPLGLVASITDPLGQTTRFEYNARNQVVAETDALGNTTRYEYDGEGDVSRRIDALGRSTTIRYDVRDRVVSVTDAAGQTAKLAYDGVDNVLALTDVAGNVTRYTYDELDRVTSATDPLGGRSTFAYDLRGNRVSATDPLGQTTSNTYDRFDRLTTIVDPALGVTRFSYDDRGRLLSLTDPELNTTSYQYDALGRVVRETNALGLSRTYVYDAASNLIAKTDRNGRVSQYAYDSLQRLTQETWVGGGNEVHWTYDAVGDVLTTSDNASRLTMTYDALSRVATIDTAGAAELPAVLLRYAYDEVGNVTSVTDSPNNAVRTRNTYTYDPLDRMTRVVQTGSNLASKRVDMEYNAMGLPTALRRYGDVAASSLAAVSTYDYDSRQQLVAQTHKNQAGTILNFETLQYDAAGRLLRLANVDGAVDYGYDLLSQLTSAGYSDDVRGDESYSYDQNGNRTNSSRHGDGYVTGPNNQLLSDGEFNYTYDGEGNLIQRTEITTGKIREFGWDYRNRLTSVVDRDATGGAETQRVEFRYDAFDRRIAKHVSRGGQTTSTYFVYDREDVLYDFVDLDGPAGQAAPQLAMTYLHGPAIDQVLAQETAEHVVDWLLTDHLGSTTDLVSSGGSIGTHVQYDAFGNVVPPYEAIRLPRYLYSGREWDAESNLGYFRSRYLNAVTGRFISEDVIGYSSGELNLAAYVANGPTNFIDPWGTNPHLTQYSNGTHSQWIIGDKFYDFATKEFNVKALSLDGVPGYMIRFPANVPNSPIYDREFKIVASRDITVEQARRIQQILDQSVNEYQVWDPNAQQYRRVRNPNVKPTKFGPFQDVCWTGTRRAIDEVLGPGATPMPLWQRPLVLGLDVLKLLDPVRYPLPSPSQLSYPTGKK